MQCVGLVRWVWVGLVVWVAFYFAVFSFSNVFFVFGTTKN